MLLAMAAVLLTAIPRTLRFIFCIIFGTLKHIQLYTISTKDTLLTILPSPIPLLIGPSATSPSSHTLPIVNVDLAIQVTVAYILFLLGLGTLVSVVGWYGFGSNGMDLSVTPSASDLINGTPLDLASFPAATELGNTALEAFPSDVHLSELEDALQDVSPQVWEYRQVPFPSFSDDKGTLSSRSDNARAPAEEAINALESDFDLSDLEEALKDVPRSVVESLRSPSPSFSGGWGSLFDESNRDSDQDAQSFSGHEGNLSFGPDHDRSPAKEAINALESDFDLSDLEDALKDVPRAVIESLRSPSPSSYDGWDSLFDESNRDSDQDAQSFSGHEGNLSFGSDNARAPAKEVTNALESDFDLSDLEDALKDVPRSVVESLRSSSPSSSDGWDSLFDDSNRDSGQDDPFAMSFAT